MFNMQSLLIRAKSVLVEKMTSNTKFEDNKLRKKKITLNTLQKVLHYMSHCIA